MLSGIYSQPISLPAKNSNARNLPAIGFAFTWGLLGIKAEFLSL
jgi:hypothetical protein